MVHLLFYCYLIRTYRSMNTSEDSKALVFFVLFLVLAVQFRVVFKDRFILVLFPAEYAVFLYSYLKEWRKNPHWSFSCCLALLLPLNDLQGDIRGVAGTNVLKSQLDTGQFEMVTLQAAIKDSGAIDVSLEENEEPGNNCDGAVEVNDKRQRLKKRSKKCDQATQTKFLSFFTSADVTVYVLIEETHL